MDRGRALLPLLESRRILICVGSGGVGKTTTAAALGLLAARIPRKTLVMTIDPARRLAAALGLSRLDHTQRAMPAHKLQAAGIDGGSFQAMMLDPKRTFDEMVRRHAPDSSTVDRLLASRLYQQISSRLAGAQEYAAMELLHAQWLAGDHELLLLDTPPSANALDFLDAPRKMVNAVESPAVSLFIRAHQQAGRLSLNLLGFGAAYVFRRLARFVGGAFLDDIAQYLAELSGMLGGMKDRAEAVQEMLRREDVGFVIVTGPDPRSIDEAIDFHRRLQRMGMAPAAVVINRVHPLFQNELELEPLARRIKDRTGVPRAVARRLGAAMVDTHEQVQVLARADEEEIQRLVRGCGEDQNYVRVPLFDEDIFDIAGLVKLGSFLA
jgi:anion-transporting  ArsA/GET3 family ATPase